jgi:DNA-binding transcriptional MerR regulator
MSDMTIGAASDATGVKVTTIRFYEGRGLLPEPPRSDGGRRLYDPAHIARLRFIKHARDLGFDLGAITALLALSDQPAQDCASADSIARAQLAAVERRITQLAALRDELARMVRDCAGGPISHCRVIESLADHANCDHARHDMP